MSAFLVNSPMEIKNSNHGKTIFAVTKSGDDHYSVNHSASITEQLQTDAIKDAKMVVMQAVFDTQENTGYWDCVTLNKRGSWIRLKNTDKKIHCRVSFLEGGAGIRLFARYYIYQKIVAFTADAINDYLYRILKDMYINGMSNESKATVDLDTLVLAPLELTRPQLQDLASTITIRHSKPMPNDWVINDADADKILFVLNFLGANAYTSEEDLNLIMGECFRLDSKTHRVITEGYVIGDDLAWFLEEADAVEWLNANGVKCSTFKEAQKKRLPKKSPIKSLYMAGWCCDSYRFSFNAG